MTLLRGGGGMVFSCLGIQASGARCRAKFPDLAQLLEHVAAHEAAKGEAERLRLERQAARRASK